MKALFASFLVCLVLGCGQTQASDSVCIQEAGEINRFAIRFGNLQRDKDVRSLLALFTLPGPDDPDIRERLFRLGSADFDLLSFTIGEIVDVSSNSCLVNINERRRYKFIPDDGLGDEETQRTKLLLVKEASGWKIEKYLSINDTKEKKKYSGWGQY